MRFANPDEVERILRTEGVMQALAYVRRTEDVNLATALEAIRAFEKSLEPQLFEGTTEMGMCAEVLGIGPFRRSLIEHYDHSPERYEHTSEGAPMVEVVFSVFSGNRQSTLLASCFGIDPWDFNRHKLVAENANITQLTESFEDYEVEKFLAFREAGYEFYFRPDR